MKTKAEIGATARSGRHVEKELRRLLESGKYPRQSKLPPERQLAAQLGVGRAPLRKGLSVLEAEGKIQRYRGRGTFVGSPPATTPHHLVENPSSPSEVFETRLMFEPLIAAIAALRAKPDQLSYMEYCLRRSETALDWEAYELWDSTLHRSIAAATQNSLLIVILDLINELRKQSDWRRLRRASLTQKLQADYSVQHRRIVAAIASRDSRAARQEMREHLASVQKSLLEMPDSLMAEP